MSETRRSVQVMISGRVQGVGYRAWTERTATRLGLSGWVRNREGGSVEAVFCGDEHAVETMLAACESGPSWARVRTVDIMGPGEPAQGPFRQLPTI